MPGPAMMRKGAEPALDSEYTVGDDHSGKRIDVVLKALEPDFSRTALKGIVKTGQVTVNDRTVAPSCTVCAGDRIRYRLQVLSPDPAAENSQLHVLFEDDWIIVVNKPAGMTVHPVRAGHGGTLVNALLGYTHRLSDAGGPLRRGIVHRLDRDTSGVMVVAGTNAAHEGLSAQFKKRTVKKEYTAIVEGCPELDADSLVMNVARHSKHRGRMVVSGGGREALTLYEVTERFPLFSVVRVRPKTGRTHQIRLALSEIGHPVACDSAYGAKKILLEGDIRPGSAEPGRVVLCRQALHSSRLEFVHPATRSAVSFEAPLASDMEEVLRFLREDGGGSS